MCTGTQYGRTETGNKSATTTVKTCKKTAAAVVAETGRNVVAPAAETSNKMETEEDIFFLSLACSISLQLSA